MEYINSPFPYAGCKFNLMEHLDSAIPQGNTLIDVFGGSGAVVYLDPPYSNTEAGYNSTWTVNDDSRLAGFMLGHKEYKYVLSSCAKDGATTRLVETLRDSGEYDVIKVQHVYKAAKKSKLSDTVELILRSKNCN
jgi:site-specific DNA-adenine methylase